MLQTFEKKHIIKGCYKNNSLTNKGDNVVKSPIFNIAGWSSPVARWAHNPKVRGSNPLPATN
jgi:hypothetical protein